MDYDNEEKIKLTNFFKKNCSYKKDCDQLFNTKDFLNKSKRIERQIKHFLEKDKKKTKKNINKKRNKYNKKNRNKNTKKQNIIIQI